MIVKKKVVRKKVARKKVARKKVVRKKVVRQKFVRKKVISIENRIYREELIESLGINFVSPFQPEREFKVCKSCKCSQIICSRVHKYSMFPRLSISISNF